MKITELDERLFHWNKITHHGALDFMNEPDILKPKSIFESEGFDNEFFLLLEY